MTKEITYEQYKTALEEKTRIEKYLEHLTKITRQYVYQEEAIRVKDRKTLSLMESNKVQ